jgi:ORF6N domain
MSQETEGTEVTTLAPVERIERCIFLVRGHKVMLDFHLAALYGVETKQLNRQVKRNPDRFPLDFMFKLSPEELEILKCQIGTSSLAHGGRRYALYAFTEQGVAMLFGSGVPGAGPHGVATEDRVVPRQRTN